MNKGQLLVGILCVGVFSGCKKSGAGESCDKTSDCEGSLRCIAQVCIDTEAKERAALNQLKAQADETERRTKELQGKESQVDESQENLSKKINELMVRLSGAKDDAERETIRKEIRVQREQAQALATARARARTEALQHTARIRSSSPPSASLGEIGLNDRLAKVKRQEAQLTIATVQQALSHWQLETDKKCPGSLRDLFTEQFMGKRAKRYEDPWGEEYVFKCPGQHESTGADIFSKGPDKVAGTRDDINSWD